MKFTGKCICGHDWDDHHHGVVMNTKALKEKDEMYRVRHGVIAEECEKDYFEGMPLKKNPCQCNIYVDKGWVKK